MSVGNRRRGSTQKKKMFEELSERQKNRRAEEISECEVDKLLLASSKAAKKSNKLNLEYVLRLLYRNQEKATKIRSLLNKEKSFVNPKKINPLRGLTFLLDNNLTTLQYRNTRLISKECGSNIFPPYNVIAETKKECRPATKCEVNDVSATLPLQELLNHTAGRLLLLQEEVIRGFKNETNGELAVKLQVKWGADGSADHSQYNQKYVNVESTKISGANFYATTLVPLRMTTTDDSKIVIWNNHTPQSPRWCRPLRLHFAKETDEFTLTEIDFVQSEIAALEPFAVTIAGVQILILYELYLTMIDGKTLAIVTRTTSKQRCCICGSTPKNFNNLENVEIRFKPIEGRLVYGLSVLHLWIRSFEWLLHISYRIDVKTWQLRGPELKAMGKERKRILQERFLKKMFIRVDFPSTGGSGNSNNGNVCRTAFSNPKLLAEILELDETLIKNMQTILIALSCQFPLDIERFDKFCKETAFHYVKLYKWFPLPPSIHKVLFHSRDIMLANVLPVGVLAEDASESCNKLYRQNREFHARKNSRQNNLEDVFNRALDSSDPIVASFGLQKRQNSRVRKNIPAEVLSLLKTPDDPVRKEQELEEIEEEDMTEADVTTMDLLEELAETLDGINLPEDPYYEECDDEEYDDNNNSDDDEGYDDEKKS